MTLMQDIDEIDLKNYIGDAIIFSPFHVFLLVYVLLPAMFTIIYVLRSLYAFTPTLNANFELNLDIIVSIAMSIVLSYPLRQISTRRYHLIVEESYFLAFNFKWEIKVDRKDISEILHLASDSLDYTFLDLFNYPDFIGNFLYYSFIYIMVDVFVFLMLDLYSLSFVLILYSCSLALNIIISVRFPIKKAINLNSLVTNLTNLFIFSIALRETLLYSWLIYVSTPEHSFFKPFVTFFFVATVMTLLTPLFIYIVCRDDLFKRFFEKSLVVRLRDGENLLIYCSKKHTFMQLYDYLRTPYLSLDIIQKQNARITSSINRVT